MRVNNFGLIKRQYILRQIDGQNFLIPLYTDPSFIKSINDTAAIFWKLIKIGEDNDTVTSKISKYFNIDKTIAKRDLNLFISNLTRLNTKTTTDSSVKLSTAATRIPLSGSFEITGKCNLRCFHCYVASERINQDLSLAKVKKIIDQLVKNGCLFLLLTGGECTSRSDFTKIYTYVRKKGIIPTINTNATLIDDKLLKLFRKYPPKRIKVSLYGPTAEVHDKVTKVEGSFNQIINNCLELKKTGLNVVFSGLIFKETSALEPEIKKFAASVDIPIIITRGLVPTLDHHSDHLCQLDKKNQSKSPKTKTQHFDNHGIYQCEAGDSSFHINSQGQMSICMMERGGSISLTNQSFSSAWSQLGEIRKSQLAYPQSCNSCSEVETCNFCPVIYNLFKSSGVLNIYCSKI